MNGRSVHGNGAGQVFGGEACNARSEESVENTRSAGDQPRASQTVISVATPQRGVGRGRGAERVCDEGRSYGTQESCNSTGAVSKRRSPAAKVVATLAQNMKSGKTPNTSSWGQTRGRKDMIELLTTGGILKKKERGAYSEMTLSGRRCNTFSIPIMFSFCRGVRGV